MTVAVVVGSWLEWSVGSSRHKGVVNDCTNWRVDNMVGLCIIMLAGVGGEMVLEWLVSNLWLVKEAELVSLYTDNHSDGRLILGINGQTGIDDCCYFLVVNGRGLKLTDPVTEEDDTLGDLAYGGVYEMG